MTCNPLACASGIEIMAIYKYGSMVSSELSAHLTLLRYQVHGTFMTRVSGSSGDESRRGELDRAEPQVAGRAPVRCRKVRLTSLTTE